MAVYRNAPLTPAQRRALLSILRSHKAVKPRKRRRKAHKRRNPAKRSSRRTASALRGVSPSSAGARLAYKRWRGNPLAKGKPRRYHGRRRIGTVIKVKGRYRIITRLRGVRVTRPWAVRRRR